MKRSILISLISLALAAPAASAQDIPIGWQQDTQAAAAAYWAGHTPYSTIQSVTYAPLDDSEGGQTTTIGMETEAGSGVYTQTSNIIMSTSVNWTLHDLCIATVHEYGHAILGPFAFQRPGTYDWGHSPDPNNVMYSGSDIYTQYIPQCQAVVLKYFPVKATPKPKPKHHKRHVSHTLSCAGSALDYGWKKVSR